MSEAPARRSEGADRYVSNLGASVGWGLLVGASLLAGAVVAVLPELLARVAALVTSFGGALLFSAVAYELVPEAKLRVEKRL